MTREEQVLLRRWRRSVRRIEAYALELHASRTIFRNTVEKLKAQDPKRDSGGIFFSWMLRLYADSTAVAIRRLADPTKDNEGLFRLLTSMRDQAAVVVRIPCLPLPDDGDVLAPFASRSDRRIRAAIRRDIGTLTRACRRTRRWTSKSVAHITRSRRRPPSFAEMHAAVDVILGVLQKYVVVLTGNWIDYQATTILPGWNVFAEDRRPPA